MSLSDWILAHEAAIRLGFFFGTLTLVALIEFLAPRRAAAISRAVRWGNNLALVFFDAILLRLLFPVAAAGMAALFVEWGWGLFNHIQVPLPLAVGVSAIALDFIIYLQHRLVHAVPLLWRVHRVHHADLDYDVTTGARFHPLEILLSMLLKFAAIAVLGPPVVAVIIFEVVLNATAMFNHGNIRLPERLDRWLRWVVVTPDMHRVHHSTEPAETDSNFGFNLPWWDRLLGTYRAQPRHGHHAMVIGIGECRAPGEACWLPGMLWLPFRAPGRERLAARLDSAASETDAGP